MFLGESTKRHICAAMAVRALDKIIVEQMISNKSVDLTGHAVSQEGLVNIPLTVLYPLGWQVVLRFMPMP